MTDTERCPLCLHTAEILGTYQNRTFYSCSICRGIFQSPQQLLSSEREHAQYLTHQNDIHDQGYRNFVMPLVDLITAEQHPKQRGLDYGAGPGPVVAQILQERGYRVTLYDPYFHPNRSVLDLRYDYIFCCEVAEHFYHPRQTFTELASLLEPGGTLYVKTVLYAEEIEFDRWYYKNEDTHVFFYHRNTIAWIAEHLGYQSYTIYDGRHFSLIR
jgi:2-polyprenyl-3-methyl-5-hydroxy-6-metoxy-1,4-benzoquinol methylase